LWNDRLRFAERVLNDWRALSPELKATGREALETLDADPIAGAPLYAPLKGLWIHRVGELRIIYIISPEARTVVVLNIGVVSAGPRR